MQQCPLCSTELEVRDCAPCHDCGWKPEELGHFRAGLHSYKTYDVHKGLQLTLCNFCEVDFGAYKPETFGFTDGRRIGFQHLQFIREVRHPQIERDLFCPQCAARLAFLNFLFDIRQMNAESEVS